MKIRSTFTTLILVGGLGAPALAGDEHREAGAHEHGRGALNMAIEGNEIELELVVPGADIVGFEFKPKSDADKAKLKAGKEQLGKVLSWMGIKGEAGCKVDDADVEFESEKEHASHDHDDHHDDHGSKKKKSKGHHDDHGHDDHGHKKEKAGEAEHAVFHAEFELECKDTSKITGFAFDYFKLFANAQKLDVNLITDKKQTKYEVTRDAPEIDLKG